MKDLSGTTPLVGMGKTGYFLNHWAFPCGFFLLLTGLFWLGDHGLYSKLFYWVVLLPAFVSMVCFPKNTRHLLASPVFMAVLVFAGYIALAAFWSSSGNSPADLMKRPLYVLLFFYMVFELGRQHFDRLLAALKWAAFFAVVAAVYTLGAFMLSGGHGRLDGYGALTNPLMVSHVFGFFLAWWLGVYLTERRLFEPLTLFAILTLVVLMLTTGSRTPLVAMTATILWLAVSTWSRKGALVVGMLLAAAVLIGIFAPEIIMQRGLSYRTEVWMNVIGQIREKLWFGHGFNTPLWVRLDSIPYPLQDPHNLTLAVFFAGGIIGVLLWLTLYLVAFLESWQWRKDRWVLVCSATVVYGLAAGMTEGGSFLPRPKEHWFLIWIPLALIAAAIYRARTRSADNKDQETTGANG